MNITNLQCDGWILMQWNVREQVQSQMNIELR